MTFDSMHAAFRNSSWNRRLWKGCSNHVRDCSVSSFKLLILLCNLDASHGIYGTIPPFECVALCRGDATRHRDSDRDTENL